LRKGGNLITSADGVGVIGYRLTHVFYPGVLNLSGFNTLFTECLNRNAVACSSNPTWDFTPEPLDLGSADAHQLPLVNHQYFNEPPSKFSSPMKTRILMEAGGNDNLPQHFRRDQRPVPMILAFGLPRRPYPWLSSEA